MAAARKPRLLRIPATVRMAGYTIPVVWVKDLTDEGEDMNGMFFPPGAGGPFIALDESLRGKPEAGDTFIHELVEAACLYAEINYDGKKFARFTHDHLTVMARNLWEGLTTARYPRRKK